MTCKDCIHFIVCDSGRHIGEHIDDDGVYSDGVEKQCPAFEAKNIVSNDGWISVEHSLPNTSDCDVLVILWGSPQKNIQLYGAVALANYDEKHGWFLEGYPDWEDGFSVSHWREIPQLPQYPIKSVVIPACDNHDGVHAAFVRLRWVCPTCGRPRGEIKKTVSYDGSRYLPCDGWDNPCGHVDKYSDVIFEAANNELN